MAKSLKIDELNQIYSDADSVDSSVFAEQRSNVLLKVGEHYNKKKAKFWSRVSASPNLTEEQKVRITKNHIQKIVKSYVNAIVSAAPGVMPTPKNERETSDMKAAQLNHAVWQDICDRFDMKTQVYEDADDFITVGEVACKVFWDENAGRFIGWRAKQNPETGEDMKDENGELVPSEEPVYTGDLVFERIYGFNLLRSKEAKHMRDNECWIIRKMADIEELKARVGNDQEKLKFITSSSDETFLIFDGTQGGYKKSDKQCLLREFYFKPCYKYPNGYYYIATQAGILWEGELPFGIFPIVYTGFDPAQTTPRHYSIIKVARPYQVELNRKSSKQVEHEIAMGDDKVLIQNGTKLSAGGSLPGIRGVQYTGMKPEILPGRTGDQYTNGINQTVEEMYRAVNLQENEAEIAKNADPFAMLYSSLRDKRKFSMYAEKFERYQSAKCKLALTLAKKYYTEDMLVPAIGRTEIVNIAEFKNTNELSYEIKLKPMVDDVETMFGKQLVMNQVIQYAGSALGKEDIGRILRNMPFGNKDESFSDFTIDYDNAQNLLLALDRGEQPQASPYDNHQYMLKKLVKRVREADFRYLDPQVQQNYHDMISIYEMQIAEQQRQLQEAQAGFIPSGGAKIKADYYVSDPTDPNKVSRATLPAEAVDWLIRRLAEQGTSQEALQKQSQGAVIEIAQKMGQGPAPSATPMPGRTAAPPPMTQKIPPPMLSNKVEQHA